MVESYPTFRALSYEFWAFAYAHPFYLILWIIGVCTIIVWIGGEWVWPKRTR